jgi:hypothetical protein
MQDSQKVFVRLDSESDQLLQVEADVPAGYHDVSITTASMDRLLEQVRLFAGKLRPALQQAKPTKASVEFGVTFSFEAGQLVAVVAKGSSSANIKICLEWSDESTR